MALTKSHPRQKNKPSTKSSTMSKYRHQGFVLQGASQEGVELELDFASLRDHSMSRASSKVTAQSATPTGKNKQSTSFSTAGEDSLYTISSADSWELEQKFDALKQIKEKPTAVEFDNVYDEEEGSYDESEYYRDNENKRCSRFTGMRKMLIIGGVCVLAAVGATVGVVLGTQKDERGGTTSSVVSSGGGSNANPPPPPGPSEPVDDPLAGLSEREVTVFNTIKPISPDPKILDPLSPQGQAFQFVANDDPAQVEGESVQLVQRYVLGSLFFSTNGGNWTNSTNWMSGVSECEWFGITCDGEFVSEIRLKTNNLTGEIAHEISELYSDHMARIVMDHNFLTGPLPPKFDKLKNLVQLEVDDNLLSGSLPPKMFEKLTKLERLELQYNAFTGTIPATIGDLQAIKKLHMYSNSLSGSVPDEIGKCTSLGKFLHQRIMMFSYAVFARYIFLIRIHARLTYIYIMVFLM